MKPVNSQPQNQGQHRAKRQENRSRFQPKARAGMRLEERDESILCDLFLHRLMTRGQIERSYFSSTVRCNARLRQLFDHQFVTRHYPPYAPFGSQAVYSVGKCALPIVSKRLEMELPEVARYYRRTKTPTFIEHTIAVVDIWMAFREAVKAHGVVMERWLPEMLCRHEWDIRGQGGRWRKEAFKPDAFVRLKTSSGYHPFFIEVDLGHTSSSQFLGKLATHQRYLESGLFTQTYGSENFKTLVITVGERRLKNLISHVQQHGSGLFWLTTFSRIKEESILSPIWTIPEGHNVQGLF